MKTYTINNKIIYQKDYRIPGHMSILDYILMDNADEEIKNGEVTILVISLDEEIYEVNLIGAIIFEMVLDGKGEEEIYSTLKEKFNVENETLQVSIREFLENMCKFNVIHEEV